MKDRLPEGRPLNFENGRINLFHGSGGRAMAQLIDELFVAELGNDYLTKMDDGACFSVGSCRMVMSTDSFVVTPLFFPGGDIGSMAVHGTVNDLAMTGAKPLYLSSAFILEEGLELSVLRRVVQSMAAAAVKAGVKVVTGDTKVVERGKMDRLFINTSGVGVIENPALDISSSNARPGDRIIVSGYIGDHGTVVMASRNHLDISLGLVSDSAPLNDLVASMVAAVPEIRCMRDPTRGGIAAALNEIALCSNVSMEIIEKDVPVRTEVHSLCELLGIDPYYMANEGRLLAFCPAGRENEIRGVMRRHPLGKDAAVIGQVIEKRDNSVYIETPLGGRRVLQYMFGEPLPRIC